MWMLPLYLHVNQKSDYDDDDMMILYRYIGKICPAPWRPCLLTNHDGLNNRGRGLQKEHFCHVILKLVQWFLTRRFLMFSI